MVLVHLNAFIEKNANTIILITLQKLQVEFGQRPQLKTRFNERGIQCCTHWKRKSLSEQNTINTVIKIYNQ